MTKTERAKLPVAVFVALIDNNKVFLMRRKNTGYEDGSFDLISGHIEGNETLKEAACRESHEEAGVTIQPVDLQFVHLTHFIGDREYIYVAFITKKWEGKTRINELNKCDRVGWYDIASLPTKLTPNANMVLEAIRTDSYYSEIIEIQS
jgi:8-oxo-dGTP pyrophosphatase MutT (NUDIX family)